MEKLRPLDEHPVELPFGLVESLYEALARVFYATQLPARDVVVARYQIHTFPEMKSLIVGVDPAGWAEGWRAGERFTGNPEIDALLEQYDLVPASYRPWPFGHAVILRASRPLNLVALASRFARIPGVSYAEPNGRAGDGNDITARAEPDGGWRLEYSLGWGDCPAGCTGRHWWTFLVKPTGEVAYAGSRGAPLPGGAGLS